MELRESLMPISKSRSGPKQGNGAAHDLAHHSTIVATASYPIYLRRSDTLLCLACRCQSDVERRLSCGGWIASAIDRTYLRDVDEEHRRRQSPVCLFCV